MKVVLAGNPNTGKTTLFNTITKSREHAGNWHGVTVDVKEKPFKFKGEEFVLCDLPGIYSLEGISEEEVISAKFIENNTNAVFVCIVDANNLRRNLYLALTLKEKCSKLVIAVNMAKEVKSFNEDKLSKAFGACVVGIDARKRKSVERLLEKIYDLSKIKEKDNNKKNFKEKNNKNVDLVEFESKSKQKYTEIDKILQKANFKTNGYYGNSKADKVLLNGFFATIIFVFVMGLVFFITFGFIGSSLSGLVTGLFEILSNLIMNLLSKVIHSGVALKFIEEGVLGGALTVLSFMPQIMIMFICLNFLEDLGYLSRVAFVFDGFFKRFGLTGRSAFSLIMGFGCTTSAVITTRNLNSKSLRQRTTMLLPFMSCSAKLPIYAVICSAFFAKHKALMVFSLYLFAILIMFLVALCLKGRGKDEKNFFYLEMPKIRVPNFSKVLSGAIESVKSFALRVGGVLMLSSMVVFLLYNFSFKLNFVSDPTDSILFVISNKLAFLFKPLGFGISGAVIAIISGVIAKEMVVSSLAIVNSTTLAGLGATLLDSTSIVHFNSVSALSFLVFILFYTPCISAILCVKKELGQKTAVLSSILQFGLAYVLSLITYLAGCVILSKKWGILSCFVIIVALLVWFVLHYTRKGCKINKVKLCKSCPSCKENGYGCSSIQRKTN